MRSEEHSESSEIKAEQSYIDNAHDCLEDARRRVLGFWNRVTHGPGGTLSARYERDVMEHKVFQRLGELNLGKRSLCFGRVDAVEGAETHYVGRIGVWDEDQRQLVSDWRAPVSESFFRAGPQDPMGLRRRRHFRTRGRELLGFDEETFGAPTSPGSEDTGEHLVGEGALRSVLESPRTGRLGDITATIQAEQDAAIRSDLSGALVIQGGPGTGKTVVGLHRAAYLIYTHRFPLAGQGVLVVGPNPVFLTYVEQVLPALGEAGVELVTIGGLVPKVSVRGFDEERTARVKGDFRMAKVLHRAVRDRQRALRSPLVLSQGLQKLILSVDDSKRIVAATRRLRRTHNAGRSVVEMRVFEALAQSSRRGLSSEAVAEAHGDSLQMREALEWMWPVLTPAHLLHDLFGSRALLRSATRSVFNDEESELLYRPRSPHASEVVWTYEDAALLDEARTLLGRRRGQSRSGDGDIRTYGHVVIDEAQDLSPMQLRMLGRRSLNGSFTLVGDVAQSSGAWAHDGWTSVLEHLSVRSEPRFSELTIGYRVPRPIMEFAVEIGKETVSDLAFPKSIRAEGSPPLILRVPEGSLASAAAECVRREMDLLESGNLAVISASGRTQELSQALSAAGIEHGLADSHALERRVSVVPARLVKGLEVDVALVVEPVLIAAESARGLRLLYVALTRATKRLCVLHSRDLPRSLARAAAEMEDRQT